MDRSNVLQRVARYHEDVGVRNRLQRSGQPFDPTLALL